jgi:hypothetical protein
MALAAPRLRRRRLGRRQAASRARRQGALDAGDHQALRQGPKASRVCPADGSSSEPPPGSDDAAGAPWTGRNPSPPRPPSSSSPTSACSPGASQDTATVEGVPSQALGRRWTGDGRQSTVASAHPPLRGRGLTPERV